MTHTPGPWTIDWHDATSQYTCNVVHKWQEDGRNYHRTIDCVCNHGTIEENEANAHLIAASPTMLEALELCKPILEQIDLTHRSAETHDALTTTYRAIAKARGEA